MTITLASIRRTPPPPPPSPSNFAVPRRCAITKNPTRMHHAPFQATVAAVNEDRFTAVSAVLMRYGGCLSADDICELLRPHWAQPLSRVARWIARREVVSMADRGQLWLPLFQFELPALAVIPAATDVVRTLRGVYDDWEMAEWFARPHDLLGGFCPAARLASDPCAVQEAARIEHFINR